jgi:hypothetical protein
MSNQTLPKDENNRGNKNKKEPECALCPLWLGIRDDSRTFLSN